MAGPLDNPFAQELVDRARSYFGGSSAPAPAPAAPADPATYYGGAPIAQVVAGPGTLSQNLGAVLRGSVAQPSAPQAPPPPEPIPTPSSTVGGTLVKGLTGPGTLSQNLGAALRDEVTPQPPLGPVERPAPAGPPAPLGPVERPRTFGPPDLPMAPVQGPAVSRGGVGGGGPVNPDPYGEKAATQKYLGSFDEQQGAMRRQGGAEASKALMVGQMAGEQVRRNEEDAAIERAEMDAADAKYAKDVEYAKQRQDEVRSRKIDPSGGVPAAALGFTALISMALQGGLGLVSKGRVNIGTPLLDVLNKHIDRDVARQEKELDAAKSASDADLNRLAQHRAYTRDAQAARHLLRIDHMTHAERLLEEQAKQYDAPIYQARADEHIAAIGQERAKEEMQLAQILRKNAMAGAGASLAKDREAQARYNAVWDQVYKERGDANEAERQASRARALVYYPDLAGTHLPQGQGASPTGGMPVVPRNVQDEAKKEFREHSDRENAKRAVDDVFRKYQAASTPGEREVHRAAMRALLKPHLKNASSDADLEKLIEPFVPSYWSLEKTNKAGAEGIKGLIDASGTTPILDASAPGWRGNTTKLDLKPVK